MFELINSDTSPLESALYDPVTGELDLVFDWDKMLQSEGVWGNIRHIDAIVFNGTPYEIEIHSDDGPRDANGFIYNRDTMENTFTLDVGTGFSPSDGTIELVLTDRADGTRPLYDFQLETFSDTPEPPTEPPTEAPEGFVYALNAGGAAFTSSDGITYEGDDLDSVREWTTNASIAGTTDDVLYQSERSESSGGFTYEVDVANGTYDVELNFAEIWGGAQNAGVRVFDVYVEGELVVNDLDLADQVGFLTAYDVIQTVAVDDGALTIEAVSGVQNAKLSGFSIWEADEPIVEPPSTDAPTFVYALNAGGGAFTAENGVVYEGDDLGSVREWTTNASIAGTADDALYQSERSELGGGFSYEVALENGTYDVELNFAEIWGGARNAGVRVFDVYVEDELVINDLDISSEVGFATALDFIGEVEVNDGALTITTDAEVQNAKLAGFSIWEAEGDLSDTFVFGSLYDDLNL